GNSRQLPGRSQPGKVRVGLRRADAHRRWRHPGKLEGLPDFLARYRLAPTPGDFRRGALDRKQQRGRHEIIRLHRVVRPNLPVKLPLDLDVARLSTLEVLESAVLVE